MKAHITQERLKELFSLDPITGTLYWKSKSRRGSHVASGQVAGGLDKKDGYWRIKVGSKTYKRSRLVFLFCTGLLPKQVDHRNRIKSDDRPSNLRAATQSQNSGNAVWPSSKHSLPKGVHLQPSHTVPNPFSAEIMVNRRRIYLGVFPTAELAHLAYCAAAKKYRGEFACLS